MKKMERRLKHSRLGPEKFRLETCRDKKGLDLGPLLGSTSSKYI